LLAKILIKSTHTASLVALFSNAVSRTARAPSSVREFVVRAFSRVSFMLHFGSFLRYQQTLARSLLGDFFPFEIQSAIGGKS
jgi:hypothetical protein